MARCHNRITQRGQSAPISSNDVRETQGDRGRDCSSDDLDSPTTTAMLPLYAANGASSEATSKRYAAQDGELSEGLGWGWQGQAGPDAKLDLDSPKRDAKPRLELERIPEPPKMMGLPRISSNFILYFAFIYSAWLVWHSFNMARQRHESILELATQMVKDMNASPLPSHFTLPSGNEIPTVGLGVWRSAPSDVGEAVKVALNAGYRHIDDAWIYGNEREVGTAIRESSVPREDIWITSKLWNSFHNPDDIEWTLDDTLDKLGTSYLDLYLIHWPVACKADQSVDWDLTKNPYPTWQKLEEMVEKGKIRNIGVSNFNIRRLQNLTANELKIKPAINQVELNYWNPQPELIKWSNDHGVLLEAYSPLGSAEKVKETLDIPEVQEIAKALNMTPAQVHISWHIQRGTVVLPKSVTPHRIEENYQVKRLPLDLYWKLENAANGHPPVRTSDPSKRWGVDIFE